MDDFILLLLMFLLLLFVCFFFLFFFLIVFVCLICVSCYCWPVCWCVLSSLCCCCCHCFGLFLFLGAGTWCSYNHLLVSKLVSFGIVYKFVVSQGSLALIRELFIILYVVNIFYQFIVIIHIDCLCLCWCVS